MRNQLLLFSFFISLNTYALNYIDYNRVINRIDEDVLNEDYLIAMNRFDSLYDNYNFIFARHCFKALQICCKYNDSIKAKKWLEKAFVQGVPIWMIRSNTLTKNVFNYSRTQIVIQKFDSLHQTYEKSINQNLRNTIDSLYIIDQRFTNKVNNGFILFRHTYHGLRWMKNNKNQFKILLDIIQKYGYPGEKLIGLPKDIEDSTQWSKNFNYYGPNLIETRTYIMFIHYYSNPHSDINIKLLENVKLGNLPPFQFGGLNDFIARWGKKKKLDLKYYNVWHIDPNVSNIFEIENRRKSIGLNSYIQQNRNKLIWIERRKNNTANSEIILE